MSSSPPTRKRKFEDGPSRNSPDAKRNENNYSYEYDRHEEQKPSGNSDVEKARAAVLLAAAQIKARLAASGPSADPSAGVPDLSSQIMHQVKPGYETIVVDCPKTIIGLVIGKGGETIKSIQEQSSASVKIDQTGAPCKITISGLPHCVAAAKALVDSKISMGHGFNQQNPALSQPSHDPSPYNSGDPNMGQQLHVPQKVTVVIDVPHAMVGKVIGRGGETIQSLKQQTSTFMMIDQDFPPGVPRKLSITGSSENVEMAIAKVREIVDGNGPAGTGQQLQHGSGANGIPSGVPPGGKETIIEVDQTMIGKLIGKRGDTIRMLQSTTGAVITINQTLPPGVPRIVTIQGSEEAVGRAVDLVNQTLSAGPAGGPNNNDRIEMFLEDKVLVGKIIGRGGETIKSLISLTGAKIQIDHQTMKVTVSGAPDAVDRGREAIQNIIDGGEPPQAGAGSGQDYRDQNRGGGGGGYQHYDHNPHGGQQGQGQYQPQYQQQHQQQQYPPQQWGYPGQQGYGYPPAGYGQDPNQGGYYGQQGGYPQMNPYGQSNSSDLSAEPAPGIEPSSQTSASTNTSSAPSNQPSNPWQVVYDDQRRPYYWNSTTGVSQWEKPAEMP